MDNLMKNLMLCTYRNGFKTVGLTPKDIHDVDKLHKILKGIKDNEKKANKNVKVYAVGVEYGANLLVRYAAEHP